MKPSVPGRIVFKIRLASGREETMSGIDHFLLELEQWRLMRESGDEELRVAAEEALEKAARAHYANVDVIAARAALEEAERANQQRAEAAKRPRPGARDPLRERIIEAMKAPKRGGMQFKDFMALWADGEKRGLTIAYVRKVEKFKVRDDGAKLSADYSLRTLANLWAEAA